MNVASAEENFPLERRLHPCNRPKQCGFATSIGTKQAYEFSASEREIDAARNDGSRPVRTGITDAKIMQIKNCFRHSALCQIYPGQRSSIKHFLAAGVSDTPTVVPFMGQSCPLACVLSQS